MNEEEQKKKLSEIWEMYENVMENVDNLGQSFYDFGEKPKKIFGEKSIEIVLDSAMEIHYGFKDGNNIPSIFSGSIRPSILHPPPSKSIFDHYMDVVFTFFSFASHYHPSPST